MLELSKSIKLSQEIIATMISLFQSQKNIFIRNLYIYKNTYPNYLNHCLVFLFFIKHLI